MDDLFMLLLLAGIFGIFYFRKKDKKKRNTSIILMVVSFALFGVFSPDVQNEGGNAKEIEQADDSKEEQIAKEKEKQAAKEKAEQVAKEKAEQVAKEKEEQVAKEKEEQEYDSFSFAEYTARDIRSEIEGNKLIFNFRWVNQSGRKTHFTALGYFDVSQGGELLEESSGALEPFVNNDVHKKRRSSMAVFYPIKLEYKINPNGGPVEVSFGSTVEVETEHERMKIKVN